MKNSKYNFFAFTREGERIAYNAVTGSLAKIDDEHFNEYLLIEKGEETKSGLNPNRKKAVYQALKRGGFIYDDDALDEIDLISFGYNKKKYSDDTLSLTIASTMDCNFNCYYCYEKKMNCSTKTYMNRNTEQYIIQFTDRFLKEKRDLNVTWYGGEPLLAADTIYRLSGLLIDLCVKKQCGYQSNIITNGYFLDKTTVDRLVELKTEHVQITIDGTKNVHDLRRFDIEKGSSFDIIMENIEYAKSFMKISIRINIDKQNSDHIEPFLNYLKDNHSAKNLNVYLGRVSDCNLDFPPEQMKLLFDSKEYFEKKLSIIKNSIMDENTAVIGAYPSRMILPCGAVNVNTYAIDPEGYVYKCWETLGNKEEAIFHVSKPEIINKMHAKWINWDPKEDKECRDCQFLTLCNGGCVLSATRGKKNCTYWRYHLQDMLALLAYKHTFQAKGRKHE